jgi:TM2 domain-containing membrane protein YozV
MAGATFGRKGAAAAAPVGRRAQFIAPPAPGPDDEMAQRREAFVAAERARSGPARKADPMASAERAKKEGLPTFPGRKTLAVAYSFWFMLWAISAHRFYLGRWISGIVQTALWYVSLMFWMAGHDLAVYPLVTGLTWIGIDLFLIPGMLRAANERAEAKAYASEVAAKAAAGTNAGSEIDVAG